MTDMIFGFVNAQNSTLKTRESINLYLLINTDVASVNMDSLSKKNG
jgi:hypothetical protein